jgi:hypothetical protein
LQIVFLHFDVPAAADGAAADGAAAAEDPPLVRPAPGTAVDLFVGDAGGGLAWWSCADVAAMPAITCVARFPRPDAGANLQSLCHLRSRGLVLCGDRAGTVSVFRVARDTGAATLAAVVPNAHGKHTVCAIVVWIWFRLLFFCFLLIIFLAGYARRVVGMDRRPRRLAAAV